MAEKKMHSGFEAPTIGEVMPKGTRIKKNPDGTISYVLPKKKTDKKPATKKK